MTADAVNDAGGVDIEGAGARIRGILREEPELMLVLGSGLSRLADGVVDARARAFAELSGFPPAGVAGHAGRFVAGKLAGKEVLLQAGRYHLYEGHPEEVVVAPVRIAALLGIRTVVFTNAAGGIRSDLATGSVVLLDDHLNATWRSPLAGVVREGEERFPDMSRPYDPALQERALAAALRLGVPLARGTYGGVLGPSYETPAEVEMLRKMGADVVGMSTVPEVLAARACGLRVLALSLVTNRAASLHGKKLTHQEVLDGARDGAARMEALITEVVRTLESGDAGGASSPPAD